MQNVRFARIRPSAQPLKPKAYAPARLASLLSAPLYEVLTPLERGRERCLARPADTPGPAPSRDGDAVKSIRVSRGWIEYPEGCDCLGLGLRAVGSHLYSVDLVFCEDEAGDAGESGG